MKPLYIIYTGLSKFISQKNLEVIPNIYNISPTKIYTSKTNLKSEIQK